MEREYVGGEPRLDIGERIRDLRWEHRLKQGELARRAGIAQNTLSRIELGEAKPSVSTLGKIARVLDIEPVDLVEELLKEGRKERSVEKREEYGGGVGEEQRGEQERRFEELGLEEFFWSFIRLQSRVDDLEVELANLAKLGEK